MCVMETVIKDTPQAFSKNDRIMKGKFNYKDNHVSCTLGRLNEVASKIAH